MQKKVVVVPEINEPDVMSIATEMSEAKGLGEFYKVSDTEYRTQIVDNRSMFIQFPSHIDNKYDRTIFKPVFHEIVFDEGNVREIDKYDRAIMPRSAYRVGWTNHATNDSRLIGYIWSKAKGKSLAREWRAASLPRP